MEDRFKVEALEDRRLMSARVLAQYAQTGEASKGGKTWAIRLTDDGQLAVRGSRINDTIRVKSTGDGFTVSIARTKAAAARASVAAKIVATFTYKKSGVERIGVDGFGGTDKLITDTVTQQSVDSYGILSRAVELRTGKLIGDPFATPLQGVYGGSNARWLARSQADIDAVPENLKTNSLLFLGDSLVDRLTSTGNAAFQETFGKTRANIIDLGLPGDTTSQMLYRIREQGLLDGIKATAVVLCVGTNNVTLTDDNDATARGIKAVVAEVRARLPKAQILVNGVLPRNSGLAEYYQVQDVNRRLWDQADLPRTKFLDVTATFRKGTDPAYYNPDDPIHLSSKGYGVWIERIYAVLNATNGQTKFIY